MQAKSNFNPELISIDEIKILRAQINSPFEFDTDLIETFEVKMALNVGHNYKLKKVKTELIIDVKTVTKPGDSQLEAEGSFHFGYIFTVANIDEIIEIKEDDSITMSDELLFAIASISYSTSRGILLTRFQGTSLSDFILPVINVATLLDNMTNTDDDN